MLVSWSGKWPCGHWGLKLVFKAELGSACNPRSGGEAGGPRAQGSLSYTESSRSGWATQVLVPKAKNKNKNYLHFIFFTAYFGIFPWAHSNLKNRKKNGHIIILIRQIFCYSIIIFLVFFMCVGFVCWGRISLSRLILKLLFQSSRIIELQVFIDVCNHA